MKRDDPQLLPICQHCGKYKGVGPCKNPSCVVSITQLEERVPTVSEKSNPCRMCKEEQTVVCNQCGQGFCETHSKGAELSKLADFHQHIGTCVECQKVVCEACWILNPNGDIVCLTHLEKERKTR